MLLHDFFDIKKPKVKEDSWHGGGNEPKDAWHSEAGEAGVAEGLPGEFVLGTAGAVGGAVVGDAVAGPMGALVVGAAGGTAGQQAGRELTEIAPLLVAGVRLFMANLPKIAQVFGKVGQAGARGVGQAAKAGAGIAAKNAGQIGIGVGAYEIGSSVADIVKDITAKVGAAVDEKTIFELATLAFKYAIPAGIVLAILYGGKQAIDSLFADPKTTKGVVEGSLEANTPNPVVVIQDLNGKILDTVNLSVAVQKYKLGNPQDIKNQLAHQAFTTIGNYIIASPMAGQPQDKTTKGVVEGGSENKYSNLSNRGVSRGINRAGDDFNRMMDLDQAESPHYKTQHQQDTKQRLKTKPMAGPKGVLPEQGVAEGGEKDRQWSNKDMERLRVATRDFDDIMASDGPDQTKHDLIKKRIKTKPMAGPKGQLPEQDVAEASNIKQRYGRLIQQRVKAARDAESNKEKPEEPQAPIGISTRDLLRQLRKPTKLPQGSDFATDRRKERLASDDRMDEEGVAEGSEQTPDQVRQTLNAWMNKDQQFKDPTERAPFQAQVWPYIQQNIKTIFADKGADGKGSYPAAPYAAWLLVQHMDATPNNQSKFASQLEQAGLDPTDGKNGEGKLQFIKDRAAVNQEILKLNDPEKYLDKHGKPLNNPTADVRDPNKFDDAGIVATSRDGALKNAIQYGNKLLVAAVQATKAQTQPSYKQGVAEGMFTKGPAIDPIIGKQINNIINRLHNHASKTKDEYLRAAVRGAVQELFDILRKTGGTYSAPGSPGIRDVAEGKPDYRIKIIGHDAKGDYYISPSTGKKVYRKAKVGDHENPKTGEHKGVSEGANYWTKLQDTRSKKINSLVDELEKSIQ